MTHGVDRLETIYYPVADLNPFHKNAHKGNVARIRASLRDHHQFKPIVVNKGTHTGRPNEVLCGSHTLYAAREEGWTELAAVTVDVDDDEAARINLVDNPRAGHPEDLDYDEQLLLELLSGLPDLGGTGYDLGDVEALERAWRDSNAPPALNDPDDAPAELPVETVTKPGDLWLLGPHRLVVGDSTDPLVWERLLGGGKADCMWTDPPYGVAYQSGMTKEEAKRLNRRTDGLEVSNDTLSPEQLADFLRSVFGIALGSSHPGAVWYVAAPAGPLFLPFGQVLLECEVWRQTLVWAKDVFAFGRSDYHYRHEVVFYGWTPGAAHHPPPDRKQNTVFEIPRPKRSAEHPTMKPVELITRHVENSTDPDDLVVDPFGGSGSTLIACHGLRRRAALIELDCRYADVILRRYQEHTGITPTREGQPHDFTAGQEGSTS